MEAQRPDSPLSRGRTIAALATAALWLAFAAWGSLSLLARESRESDRVLTPSMWPATSRLERAHGKPTLLMFVHPNCSCTRASVAQLTQIISSTPHASRPHVIFVARPAVRNDWRAEWLLSLAKTVPGATIVRDTGMAEAQNFRASISGQVLLYAEDGTLLFDGGVTMGRGHQGDNDAAESLKHALELPRHELAQTALFGCVIEPAIHRSER